MTLNGLLDEPAPLLLRQRVKKLLSDLAIFPHLAALVKVEPVSGYPEWLPGIRLIEERFIGIIREQYQLFGFTPIETPAVERMEVLTQGVDPLEVVIETEDGVDLLPATIELARAEADLLTRTGREHVVKGAVEQLAEDLADTEEGPYDWVLLDCPPSLGVLTVAALTAADGVLVPLQCETLSHRGVGQLLDTVHDVRRFTNRGLEVWGVLPTLYDGRTNHARTVLETISETYDLEVVEPPIPKTIKFAEAPAAGRSILATSSWSVASWPTARCLIQLSNAPITSEPLLPNDSPQPTMPPWVVTRT